MKAVIMGTYTLEQTKTIVVTVEAESEAEAKDIAINNDDGFDGAWDRAETVAVVLE